MNVPPETRRANRWLLVGLVLFAVGLCVLVLVWMRIHTKAQGGIVYPPTSFYDDGVERVHGRIYRTSFFQVAGTPPFCHFSIA